jgi:hypothetical protein
MPRRVAPEPSERAESSRAGSIWPSAARVASTAKWHPEHRFGVTSSLELPQRKRM